MARVLTDMKPADQKTEDQSTHGPSQRPRRRRFVVVVLVAILAVWFFYPRSSDTSPLDGQVGTEKDSLSTQQQEPEHPLDPALEFARSRLAQLRQNVHDYTATLIKRERIGSRLRPKEWAQVKVRHERTVDGKQVPFSVYMKFLQPKSMAGREVIWVRGQNNNKLIAHETGIKNIKRLYLATNGWLAMLGNRYPITEIGIETLVKRLIEKGERDKLQGDCEVQIRKGETVGRVCKVIRVIHPDKQPEFDFHIAEIFIDKELNLPIRYAAYMWPKEKGGEPPVDEEYTYKDLKINVGLADKDFDPANKEYNFPSW